MSIELFKGDCLEVMKNIPNGSVDMILTDPPYGTMKGAELDGWKGDKTNWDVVIDHEEMLAQCNKVLRTNGSLVLFAQDPYTAKLTMETHGNLPFSYRLTWLKDHFANALLAKKAPVNYTEDICVFFKKYDTLNQHPLREYSKKIMNFCNRTLKEINVDMGHRRAEHFFYVDSTQFGLCTDETYQAITQRYQLVLMSGFMPFDDMLEIDRRFSRRFNLLSGEKYKSNVLAYKKDYTGMHPTQKPVKLIEDLVGTYTNEGETVLDFTMGSGTTGVACMNLNRNFVGIEIGEEYYQIAVKRIKEAQFYNEVLA